MTCFELKQLVCNTLNVLSYRIGLQYEGKNRISGYIMDMLDCYSDNHILSNLECNMADEWLKEINLSKLRKSLKHEPVVYVK